MQSEKPELLFSTTYGKKRSDLGSTLLGNNNLIHSEHRQEHVPKLMIQIHLQGVLCEKSSNITRERPGSVHLVAIHGYKNSKDAGVSQDLFWKNY